MIGEMCVWFTDCCAGTLSHVRVLYAYVHASSYKGFTNWVQCSECPTHTLRSQMTTSRKNQGSARWRICWSAREQEERGRRESACECNSRKTFLAPRRSTPFGVRSKNQVGKASISPREPPQPEILAIPVRGPARTVKGALV